LSHITDNGEIDAEKRPERLVRRSCRRALKLLRSIIGAMDPKYFPGSCCG